MVTLGIALYLVIMAAALIYGFFSLRANHSRNALIKAALYHYFLNDGEAENETLARGGSLPSSAYRLAIGKFRMMNDATGEYEFCLRVLNNQVKTFGGQNAMLQAARRRHFPK